MTTSVVLSEASHKARQLIQDGKNAASGGFLMIGAGLCLVSDNKLHKLEGRTFDQYIAEAGFSHAGAYQMMQVFRKFGHLDVKGILHTRLISMTSIPMDEPAKAEAISAARELGPRDFEIFVATKKGKTPPSQCEHAELITICKKCNARIHDAS